MTFNLRRFGTAAMWLTVAVLGVTAARMGIERAGAQVVGPAASGATIVPYTVVLREIATSASGKSREAPSQTWAVRSDGAMALKIDEAEGSGRKVHLPDGTRIDVSDFHRSKSTMRKPYEESFLRTADNACAFPSETNVTDIAQEGTPTFETVRGYRAAKYTRSSGEYWYALDGGCALIKRRMYFQQGGYSDLLLVSLIVGEPSPAIFDVPASYKEVPLSEYIKIPDNCDPACADSLRRHIERLDAQYAQYRAQ
jgi:hypothetical protein